MNLGVFEEKKMVKGNVNVVIILLGCVMVKFLVLFRYVKMFCLGYQEGCMEYIIVIVFVFMVKEIFVDDNDREVG